MKMKKILLGFLLLCMIFESHFRIQFIIIGPIWSVQVKWGYLALSQWDSRNHYIRFVCLEVTVSYFLVTFICLLVFLVIPVLLYIRVFYDMYV